MNQKERETELTVLLPCLNEEANLPSVISRCYESFHKLNISGEILVADNGSTDRSREVARKLGARVIDVAERGYGAALRAGIVNSSSPVVAMADCDDTYEVENLGLFLNKLSEGYDLVIGNRFTGKIEPGAMPWLHRHLGNPILSWIGNFLYGTDGLDYHCGLRVFNRNSMIKLDLKSSGFEFASEMICKAAKEDCRISQVPTTLRKSGSFRESHLRTWSDGWRHLKFLVVFRFQ